MVMPHATNWQKPDPVLFVTLLNIVISLIVSSFVKIVLKQHSYLLGVA